MKVGILKTGRPPSSAIPRFGDYPAMFRGLLGEDAYGWRTWAVDEGELPAGPADCDAYIVTGSACGVYDDLPWIAAAGEFLNAARGRAALVGICFGHQLMAQAFGGKVIKSPKGWGVGEHTYAVTIREPWMDADLAEIRLPASHQDQVVELPPGAEVWACSDFCTMGALVWPGERAMSLQLHPEFDPAYAAALIESRRGDHFTDAEADRALASFGTPDDRAVVGRWIGNFLRSPDTPVRARR